MTIQITILGLGQVGASLGLALASQKEKIYRVGNDLEPNIAKAASRLGAVDKVVYNLPSAVEKADVVIFALPVDEIYTTLKTIAPDLKPGAVVFDMSPLQLKKLEWAQELLPAERYFVSLTPIINAAYLEESPSQGGDPHADLFKDNLMIITHSSGVDPDAIKLAADLTNLLGADPFFCDPLEADGLLAASHMLPRLVSAALANAVIGQPGWSEGRKLAGRPFSLATSPLAELDERKLFGQTALLNRENVLRVLDNFSAELHLLRQAIAEEDEKTLAERLELAQELRLRWWAQRKTRNYEDAKENPLPTAGEMLGGLIGLRGRKKEKK